MLRMVLDYADDVDEAVELIKQYNLHDSANTSFHYMVADATSKSAILHRGERAMPTAAGIAQRNANVGLIEIVIAREQHVAARRNCGKRRAADICLAYAHVDKPLRDMTVTETGEKKKIKLWVKIVCIVLAAIIAITAVLGITFACAALVRQYYFGVVRFGVVRDQPLFAHGDKRARYRGLVLQSEL